MTARLLGQNAAAKLLGVSVPKLLEWTEAGRLPVVHDTRNGKPWPRWSEAALIEWQQELGRIAARALNERGAVA